MKKTTFIPALFLVLCSLLANAQTLPVKINITVAPPYPVSVSYYADHPQQVLVQVMNLSRTEQSFRLSGSINGLDNNVKVVSKDRGASGVITLNALESRLLSVTEIQDLFDAQKLVFTGINYRRDQIDDGLPEGLYQVCAVAVDAVQTNLQRSEQTCSNAFQVTNLEPPIIIQPLADAEIKAMPVQNMLFTWTLPASAPPTTEYTLRMVEVISGMNPNNALQAATTPIFFERTVKFNTLLYGPADPPLVAGRKYAFMVTADDPMRKAVFRNGGRSAVQVFTYTGQAVNYTNTPTNTSQDGDLFFTYPNCLRMINGKYSKFKEEPQRIYTDEDTPISLTWLWKAQAQRGNASLLGNPAAVTYQGAGIGHYEIKIRRAAAGQLKDSPKNSNALSNSLILKKQVAEKEFVQISYAEAIQANLLDSSVYVADMDVFGKDEKKLLTVTSCPFTLRNLSSGRKPMITLKGKLKYKFQNDPSAYPANHVSGTVSYAPLHKTGQLDKKSYFTTDAEGNFTASIERDSSQYVLHFTLNSPYYKTELATDTVNLSTFQKDPTTGKIYQTGYQKVVDLGELTTQVYGYDLTVRVRKGFPKFSVNSKTVDVAGKDFTFGGSLTMGSLDTLTVKSGAVVKDGIPVRLYRKSKPTAVPFYENGIKISDFASGKDMLVGEAKTATEIDKQGKPFSVVRFKNLVLNLLLGDEYYLKAFIEPQENFFSKTKDLKPGEAKETVSFSASTPAANYNLPGSNNGNPFTNPSEKKSDSKADDENLIGPEMRVVFGMPVSIVGANMSSPLNKNQGVKISAVQAEVYQYDFTFDYNLISTTPPMSHIKGRIVYSWPSSPNVIRPLRNKDVTVKLVYTFDGKLNVPYSSSKCTVTTSAVYKPGTEPDDSKTDKHGLPVDNRLPMQDENFVVGVGKTDDNGNFELNIINHNPKGEYAKEAVLLTKTSASDDPDCTGRQVDINVKTQQDKTPVGIIQTKKDQVYDPFTGWNEGILSNGGNVMMYQDGLNPLSNSGFSNGLLNTKGVNFGQDNLSGGFASQTLNKQLKNSPTQNKSKGPAPDAWEDYPEDLKTVDVKRVFQITSGDYMSGNITGEGNLFTIQAFESKDFGTIKLVVDEEMNRKIQVKAKDPAGTNTKPKDKSKSSSPAVAPDYDFSNARLLVYRNKLSQDLQSLLPEGEGTANHPLKPINPTSFDDKKNDGTPVEWVLDTTLSCNKDGIFDLSSKKLLSAFNYQFQVSADPAKTGTRFDAITHSSDFLKKNPPNDVMEVIVGNSRIAGRLYDVTTGKGVAGTIQLQVGQSNDLGNNVFTSPTVDTSGYFEFENNKAIGNQTVSWTDNQTIHLTGNASGYKSEIALPFNAKEKGMNYFSTLKLQPGGKIYGLVKNEENKFIQAYIERADGAVFENRLKPNSPFGPFAVAVPDKPQQIKIIPKDPAYFDSTLALTGSMVDKDLNTIILFKRKHRIQFNLAFLNRDGDPYKIGNIFYLKNHRIKVRVNNEASKTYFADEKGIVQLSFENVSVNNFTIQITDSLQAFIPQSFNLKNVESKEFQVYPVRLKEASMIRGTVTLNGKPVPYAKVYADYQSLYGLNGYSPDANYNALQTFTNTSGYYTLPGLPSGKIKLKIRAVLDTTFAVNGAEQVVDMANIPKSVNFDLKKIGDFTVDNLLGFPLVVENISVTEAAKQTYTVTGLLDFSKANSEFKWLDPNTKIRVKDVPVMVVKGKAVANVNSIELQATAGFKMKYKDRYNVYVGSSTDKNNTAKNLNLTRSGKSNNGYLQAYTSITDNSFNYPSTYLQFDTTKKGEDFFYLGTLEKNKVQTFNRVLTTDGSSNNNYRLCNKDGDSLRFSFIGFTTAADPQNSYIDANGAFRLNVKVSGSLNYSNQKQAISFQIPDLVLDNNTIKPAKGNQPLVFDLQDWKLEVRDWTMDPQQGGLVSSNCLVKTGTVDIPAHLFNLRHDMFVLKDFETKNIQLGGGLLTLSEVSPNANLLFDEKCGSDLKGHWRLAISGNGTESPAAKIKNLQPFTDATLNIDFIQLISYNQGKDNLLSLGETTMKSVFNNNYLSFQPRFIASNPDNFSLTGDLNFAIPRVPAAAATIKFTKDNNNALQADLQPISNGFEGLGYVKFTEGNQVPVITNGVMSLAGSVVEPGKFDPIDCVFQFGNNQTPRIFLPNSPQLEANNKNKFVTLTGDTKLEFSSNIDKNGMWVDGNAKDWNNLRFSGTVVDDKNKDLLDPLKLDFVVYGEVQVNSDSVKVSDISTPLGNMNLVYNFADKELVGTLQIKGVEMGSYKVDADIESRMGAKGFLLSGAASVNTGTLLVEGLGTFKMGFALGNYYLTPQIITKVTQFSLDQGASCWLKNANTEGFKGIFMTGGYNIIDVKKEFNAVVVSAYVHAALGAEASFGLSKNNGEKDAMLKVGVYGLAEAGMEAITGTSIEGSVAAHVSIEGAYNFDTGNYAIEGDADLTFNVLVKQSLLVKTLEFPIDLGAGVNIKYSKTGSSKSVDCSFHLGKGVSITSCNPQ